MILFFGMLLANESPRFLAQISHEKALAVLSKLRNLPPAHSYIQDEMAGISRQLEEERDLAANNPAWGLVKEAFVTKSHRKRSFLCITLMMWSNLTGTNAMTYYSPEIFKSVGLSTAEAGLFATGIYGIVKMVACAVFILFVTDTLGRRRSLLWTGVVQVCFLGSSCARTPAKSFQGLALFYVGFYIRFDPPSADIPLDPAGYVAIVAIYIFAAVYQFGWGPVVWTYCAVCKRHP